MAPWMKKKTKTPAEKSILRKIIFSNVFHSRREIRLFKYFK
jgi:hypothetical protein